MTSLTCEDLVEYVVNMCGRHNISEPAAELTESLLNDGLHKLADESGFYQASWTPTVTAGTPTIDFGESVISITDVKWDGNALAPTTRQTENVQNYGWEDSSRSSSDPVEWWVDGRVLHVEPPPDEATSTKLACWTIQYTSDLTRGQVSNPLAYLPRSCQRAPAYYALMVLMPEERDPQLGVLRKSQFARLWEQAVLDTVAAIAAADERPFVQDGGDRYE